MPAQTRYPLPMSVVAAIATSFTFSMYPAMALCWVIMVDTYLRPGEILEMAPEQIVLPRR